jgi:hypothetical protein
MRSALRFHRFPRAERAHRLRCSLFFRGTRRLLTRREGSTTMVGQRPGGRLPPLNVSSSVPSTVCPSPRGMRSAALTASASAPSLSAPGSRLPSRISLRPRSDLHPLGSRTHHAGSKARKKPPLLAPLDSEGSFERAAGKLYLSLQMLSSDLQHVKGKLNDSDYRYDGPRERLVDLHDLRSQAVRHLGHKVAQIEVRDRRSNSVPSLRAAALPTFRSWPSVRAGGWRRGAHALQRRLAVACACLPADEHRARAHPAFPRQAAQPAPPLGLSMNLAVCASSESSLARALAGATAGAGLGTMQPCEQRARRCARWPLRPGRWSGPPGAAAHGRWTECGTFAFNNTKHLARKIVRAPCGAWLWARGPVHTPRARRGAGPRARIAAIFLP